MAKLTLTDIAAGYALIATINANNALIETAMENTLSRDGTTPNTMSADLDMNSQQVTNLPTPTNAVHAANKDYVDTQVTAVSTASGSFSTALAYDFTNQIDFSHADGIRVMDAGGADYVKHYADTVNAYIEATGLTDYNFSGFTGSLDLHDGMELLIYDSTNTKFIQIEHNDTDAVMNVNSGDYSFEVASTEVLNMSAVNVQAYANLLVRDGHYFRVYDTGNDFFDITHDGSEINFTSAGTDSGSAPIVFDNDVKFNGTLGFYDTSPIAQQTGVAVSAAGVHAALVNLGLITA